MNFTEILLRYSWPAVEIFKESLMVPVSPPSGAYKEGIFSLINAIGSFIFLPAMLLVKKKKCKNPF